MKKKILAVILSVVMVIGCFSILSSADFAPENVVSNGTMSETTNGALTYWMSVLKEGCTDSTIAQASRIRYGSVRVNAYNGSLAAFTPNSSSPIPYEAAMEQLDILIPNGIYTLSAYVYSNTTDEDKANGAYAKMYAYANDGSEEQSIDIPATDAWTQITLPNIVVTNGKCRVGFAIKSLGTTTADARCLGVDNVELKLASSTVQGTLTYADNTPASGAKISIEKDGAVITTLTVNDDGSYGPVLVPVGDCTVTAEKPGYSLSNTVSFAEGEAMTLNLRFDAPLAAYYFDADNGSDEYDGRTPETPWKSIDKFNATTFQPGDVILFKSGCSWEGATLIPRGSGTEEAPITVGKYGDADSYPAIHANYVPGTPLEDMSTTNRNALQITGVSYWTIGDLELTNYSVYNDTMSLDAQKTRRAVTITSSGDTMRNVTLDGLYIHDINGWNPKGNADNGCGISFGASGRTYIDGLTIQNCIIKDVTRDGITGGGYTGSRPWGWGSWDGQSGTPIRHQNVVIRNNVLDTIAGDGIVITGTNSAVVEHNLVTKPCNNPCRYPSMSGNAQSNLSAAVWSFDADNTIFQYNEVCYASVPRGTEVADGEAFDGDYYCVNTLFQYNYSHDNEGGALMICGPAYSYSDGVVFRYNISENDGSFHGKRSIFEIGGGGGVNRSYIYNNTIYTSEDHTVFSVVRGEPWDGKPQGTHFYNNIFCINGMTGQFGFAGDPRDIGKDGIVEYSHNLYCGSFFDTLPKDMPEDEFAVFGDPMFIDAGNAGDGYENAKAYMIREGSAAIRAGMYVDPAILGQRLAEDSYTAGNGTTAENKAVYFHVDGPECQWQEPNGGIDFFGNPLPDGGAPDIGAHQLTPAVDYSELLALYSSLVDEVEEDYTPESWAPFASAMADAEQAIDSAGLTQSEVDALVDSLSAAADALIRVNVMSVGAEKPTVTANEPVILTVVTSADVKSLTLTNENGMKIGKTLVSKEADGDTLTWRYWVSLGTAGVDRELTFTGYDSSGNAIGSNSVTLTIVSPQAAVTSFTLVTPEPIYRNDRFTVQLVTSKSVNGINFYSENGNKIGRTLVSKTSDGDSITWVYTTSFGTAGTGRQLNAAITDKTGAVTENAATLTVDILAN